MREIKFRAQRYGREWVYGYLVKNVTGMVFIVSADADPEEYRDDRVMPETVGQYTGLTDADGREIYEGDIVRCEEFVYEVVYEPHRFASFGLRRDADVYMHYFGEAMESKDCRVIGNIHDNPELLRGDGNARD